MKAAVVSHPGGPEVLQIKDIPIPTPKPGWVLIKVKAFGLNRSEMYTRQGHSPSVRFPRVLGIECVGTVEDSGGTSLQPGQKVAAIMGEMGRAYNGGYAEYALIPASQVMPITTDLPWEILAAIPETYLTAWGSLVEALDVQPGQKLLIRGGTSALGMAAISIAKTMGLYVVATTRSAAKSNALLANGADDVIIDTGRLAPAALALLPGGFDCTLDLIGTVSILDSLHTVRQRGTVCMSGLLGNEWTLHDFQPLDMMPSTARLTIYTSETITTTNGTPALQDIVDNVQAKRYSPNLHKIFRLDEIAAAHRYMEENHATGKLVVLID